MKEELNDYFISGSIIKEMSEVRNKFLSDINGITSFIPEIKIEAPIDLIATTSFDENYIYLFLTNIRGVTTVYGSDIKTVTDVEIGFTESVGTEEVYMLPFLGNEEKIKSKKTNGEIKFTISEIEKGIVIRIKRN